MANSPFSRRTFLGAGAAALASQALPLRGQGVSPNSELRTAHIGVGGMGWSDLRSVASHPAVEVAALCDVDAERLQRAKNAHTAAREFVDFRELIAAMGDQVDAVVVSTPDHTHAPAAMTALRAGKPVYCQKPLTHDIDEARRLADAAGERNLPTQMGIQIHSAGVYRQAREILRSGVLGKVRRIDCWCNKGWGYEGGTITGRQPPPASLAWDLWLGTADWRPYAAKHYHPAAWRRLVDFGTGTLGDMGVHILDTPYAALGLTAPVSVTAACRPPTGVGHPSQVEVRWEFPGTDLTSDPLTCVWRDGGLAPPTLDDAALPRGFELPPAGSFVSGEEGGMLLPHIGAARLFPEQKFASYQAPEVESIDHYHEWVDACRGASQTSAPFSYGGALTEALLVGVVATRFPGQTLAWDAERMRFTDVEEANGLIRRTYRDAFGVEGLSGG
ncbi:Gfo/Idh/MocA family oxidoreductase [Botrimarina sp.]|uniref:Gfo/Idh/MocA family oxidoreductase n=1 Tax=Botrimarina sp. TaxID=2795802 RepID=UPI0032EAA186